MNEMKIFKNTEFGELRTTMIDGEPWFAGRDVAIALGYYAKPENALSVHVEDDDETRGGGAGSGSNYKSKTILVETYGD